MSGSIPLCEYNFQDNLKHPSILLFIGSVHLFHAITLNISHGFSFLSILTAIILFIFFLYYYSELLVNLPELLIYPPLR